VNEVELTLKLDTKEDTALAVEVQEQCSGKDAGSVFRLYGQRVLTKRQVCRKCGKEWHDANAAFCAVCGNPLTEKPTANATCTDGRS